MPSVNAHGEHPVNAAHDAVILSMSAIVYMVNTRYAIWRNYRALARVEKFTEEERKQYAEYAARDAQIVVEACRKLDEVMQYIGDCNNATDAVDEYGNTEAAFAAMDRAMGRKWPDDDE